MFDNHLPVEAINALTPGDSVIFEGWRSGWSGSEVVAAKVVRLTPKQVVLNYDGPRGTIETRFRREDGGRVGANRGWLLDPMHPATQATLAAKRRQTRQQQIDALSARWSRERDNLGILRRLQVAISEYLDAETSS